MLAVLGMLVLDLLDDIEVCGTLRDERHRVLEERSFQDSEPVRKTVLELALVAYNHLVQLLRV